MSELTIERAREMLSYSPSTGVLTWKSGPRNGLVAGCLHPEGYLKTRIDDRLYLNHRLIWLMLFGHWPKNDIDHINGEKNDNRLANIRDVTRKTNLQNQKMPSINNKSGFLGVTFDKRKKKFRAEIGVDRKHIFLGRFQTPEEAHQAYLSAKRQLHAGCTI